MHDSTKFALNYEENDISLANLSSTGKKQFRRYLSVLTELFFSLLIFTNSSSLYIYDQIGDCNEASLFFSKILS